MPISMVFLLALFFSDLGVSSGFIHNFFGDSILYLLIYDGINFWFVEQIIITLMLMVLKKVFFKLKTEHWISMLAANFPPKYISFHLKFVQKYILSVVMKIQLPINWKTILISIEYLNQPKFIQWNNFQFYYRHSKRKKFIELHFAMQSSQFRFFYSW